MQRRRALGWLLGGAGGLVLYGCGGGSSDSTAAASEGADGDASKSVSSAAGCLDCSPAGSTVIADVLTPFQVDVFFPGGGPVPSFGTVQSQVVRTPLGTLDFYWRIHVEPQQADCSPNYGVSWFDLQSFFASAWDAGWRDDGPGHDVPVLFGASGTPGEATFQFIHQQPGCDPQSCHGGIGSTFDSRFFFLRTDATQYAQCATFRVNLGDLFGERRFGVSPRYPTFAPQN